MNAVSAYNYGTVAGCSMCTSLTLRIWKLIHVALSLMGDGFVLSSTSREYLILWFCVGECDTCACRCMCARWQIPAYLNKHKQMSSILKQGLDHNVGESLHHVTVSTRCYVHLDSYRYLKDFILLLSPLLLCLFWLSQTCPLPKTFLSGRTTIRAAPPPPCPCAALKGFPSWRLSWWWGLSVYYWVFCSPNSSPSVASPLQIG